MELIENWKKCLKLYSVRFHIVGLVLSGISTALALVYGAADSIQHSLLHTWETYLIFFIIFLGAFIGRLIKQ